MTNDDKPRIVYGGLDKPWEAIPPWDRKRVEIWNGDEEELGSIAPRQGPSLTGIAKAAFATVMVVVISVTWTVSSFSLVELLQDFRR